MHVSELFDPDKLAKHLDDRLVTARRHPVLPLTIWNYTDNAQYGWKFDEVLVQCRGLVTDDNGRVVARPFDKFFSADQPGHAEIDLDEPVHVYNKVDGSLICVTNDEEYGFVISSRGSFESDQAIKAAQLLQPSFDGLKLWKSNWKRGFTFMFELIGPSNRIVLEYPEDELIALGARYIQSGRILTPWFAKRASVGDSMPMRTTELIYVETMRDLLKLPDQEGREGYVIYTFDHPTRMLKYKFSAYVDLHRIIFGMNERTVWEKIGEGLTLEQIIDGLPDEIHGFVTETYNSLMNQAAEIRFELAKDWRGRPMDVDRKTFAAYATRTKYPALMFAKLDGRDVWPMIWKMVYPKAVK